MSRDIFLFIAVFFACLVEGVEALTIVLAAGITRDWQSTFVGVGAALVVLAALTAGLGPALTALPIDVLRLIVGGVLLIFGLQWLRKAILRSSGLKGLHDEEALFEQEVQAARSAPTVSGVRRIDPYAFTLSFKGVLLEGLEVAFIVITFGSNQHNIGLAAIAAAAAVLIVIAAGTIAKAPLTRVPENTLKYAVGVMLVSFGMFWSAEGAGAHWPGSDAAILVLIGFTLAISVLLIVFLRKHPRQQISAHEARSRAGRLRAFGNFLYDFLIGDDPIIAAAVVIGLAITALISKANVVAWWVVPVTVVTVLATSLIARGSNDASPSSQR